VIWYALAMLRRFCSQVFPSRCLVCGGHAVEHTLGVCTRCASHISAIPKPVCQVCGNPVGTEGVCLRCQTEPPPFDKLMSAAVFSGPIKDIIHSFKYGGATYYKKYLSRVLYDLVKDEVHRCDVISFVPLHWTRMMVRGYNQAALMARELSHLTRVPVGYGILKKTRGTAPQVGLSRPQRRKNVSGAFHAQGVSTRSVLVVDDVITTGHTAIEVSRALKNAGAEYVLFVSVGRMVA